MLVLLTCLTVLWPASPRTAHAAEPAANASSPENADQLKRGKAIFHEKCIACHGENGAGTKASGLEPLVGDHPLPELAQIIADTMPEDDPGTLSDDEAATVAAYIHEAFYSPAAQFRNSPPRIELARLTVNQYRNSIADIIAAFRGRGVWKDAGGLDGEYYNGKSIRRNKLRLERKDPTVDFDFGTSSPLPGEISDKEFSIRWRGGIFAPETGVYEFIIHSDCGFRLSVNSPETPIIDRWVKSGDETEFRTSIFLLGGRSYPVELETFKYGQETARLALLWKPPHGVEEVIPAQFLASGSYPQTLIVSTKFPPDDESTGYERGTSVSPEWEDAATFAAIETADKILADIDRLADLKDKKGGTREERLRRFGEAFAKRAFRRPLNDAEKAFFIDASFAAAEDELAAVRRLVLLTLKSPRFLYPNLRMEPPDAYDTMANLALTMWDSVPNDEMLVAAAKATRDPGSFDSQEVARWAERMLDDPRTRAKTRQFFQWWLMLDHFAELPKDTEKFAGFDDRIAADLKRSLWLQIDEVIWSGEADFRQLMTTNEMYVNGRLAEIYGIPVASDSGFEKREIDPQQRAGIISHPLLMAGFAYSDDTSPIHRGVFLTRNVIGRTLRPPPEDFTPLPADLHAGLTTRQRVALQTESAACQKCHSIINPLGFALESFDAIGRFRTASGDKPIDVSGGYTTLDGEEVRFDGVRSLATFLASSPEVHDAFIERVFQHFVKQSPAAYGDENVGRLREKFIESDYNIRQLFVEVATVAATRP